MDSGDCRMSAIHHSCRNILLAAALTGAVALGGCSGGEGVGLDVDAPILSAVGINLSGKKNDEDIPERPGLVVPPSTEALPPPVDSRLAANQQNWPDDPDRRAKREAEEKAAAQEKYCKEGDWSQKADIKEFEQSTGNSEAKGRCPSVLGEALNKQLGGRSNE